MGCPTDCALGDNLVFSVTTHDPDTGVLTDADAVPTYRVYEDETATAIMTGNMAKLDDANTTGFYTKSIACTSGNSFEVGKTYTVYIEATVDSDKGGICYAFKVKPTLVSGRYDASVGAMAADVVTAAAIAADAIGASELAAGAVTEIQSGLATSAALATVQSDTDDIQSRLPAALVSGRMDSNAQVVADKTGYALSAAGVQAIWDALTSALTTAGSIGKKLADWVLGSDSKVILSNNAHTGAVIPTVTAVTNDVGITQVGADKVWSSATRTLTSFGTLVADIWAYGTRTLSAFSTGLAVSVWDVLETAIATGSSIGLKVKTNLDAAITTRATPAEVNAQCDTALADYDAPTKTELDAGLAALNDVSTAEVNAACDTAISDAALATAASLAAVSAFVDTEVASILAAVDTEIAEIIAAIAALNDLSSAEAEAAAAAALAAYDPPTDAEMLAAFAALNDLSAAEVNAEVDTALNTAIPGGPTANSINERVKAIDDKLPTRAYLTGTNVASGQLSPDDIWDTPSSRSLTDVTSISSAIWGYAMESGFSMLTAIRVMAAVIAGKVSGYPGGPAVFRNLADDTDRVTATHDEDGNRTGMSYS